jgi:hypothetical protein
MKDGNGTGPLHAGLRGGVALLNHKIGYVVTLHLAGDSPALPSDSPTSRTRSTLDQSTVNRIHALSRQNLLVRAIGRGVGVSHETVRKVLLQTDEGCHERTTGHDYGFLASTTSLSVIWVASDERKEPKHEREAHPSRRRRVA